MMIKTRSCHAMCVLHDVLIMPKNAADRFIFHNEVVGGSM